MGDTVFFQDFRFNDYVFNDMHHKDNSHGVDMHFIAFMKQGRGLIVSGNTRLEIGEKDLFYIPKGCRYHSYWIGDPIVNFDSIGFRFFPVWFGSNQIQIKLPSLLYT